MEKFKGFPSADKQKEMFFRDKNRRVSCKSQSAGSVIRWPDKVGFWWVRDKWDELYFAESMVEDGVMKIEGHGGGMMRSKLERHDLAETGEFVFITERSPFTQNDLVQGRVPESEEKR